MGSTGYTLLRPMEARSPAWVLAGFEEAIEMVLRGRVEKAAYLARWEWSTPLYPLYMGAVGGGYRRVTGGLGLYMRPGYSYLGLAVGGCRRLSDAVELARDALESMGFNVDGLLVEGGRVAYGATLMERTCVVEIVGEFDERLVARLGVENEALIGVNERLVASFEARSWRLYRGAVGGVVGFGSKRGAWARVRVEHDGHFVSKVYVDGVFLAAPPMEVYSLAAILEGVPLDNAVETFDIGLESRVELYGVSRELLTSLLEKAIRLNAVKAS